MARTRAEGFGPEVTRRILLGTYALSAGYYDAFYGQAQKVRSKIISELNAAYERVDVLDLTDQPDHRFRTWGQDPGSAGDVPVGRVHDPVEPVGSPGDIGADRSR